MHFDEEEALTEQYKKEHQGMSMPLPDACKAPPIGTLDELLMFMSRTILWEGGRRVGSDLYDMYEGPLSPGMVRIRRCQGPKSGSSEPNRRSPRCTANARHRQCSKNGNWSQVVAPSSI